MHKYNLNFSLNNKKNSVCTITNNSKFKNDVDKQISFLNEIIES